MKKVCCFAGHREIADANELYRELISLIKKLIEEENVTEFRVGHYGDFDNLCAKAVRELKEKYLDIHLDYAKRKRHIKIYNLAQK